jgi:hypothetical protein
VCDKRRNLNSETVSLLRRAKHAIKRAPVTFRLPEHKLLVLNGSKEIFAQVMDILHPDSRDFIEIIEIFTEFLVDMGEPYDDIHPLLDTCLQINVKMFTEDSMEYEYELRRQIRLRSKMSKLNECQDLLQKAVCMSTRVFGKDNAREHWRVSIGQHMLDDFDRVSQECILLAN